MPYETEHIAAQLKHAREAKALSQRELSRLSGLPQSHISKIEANDVDLRVSSLTALAHALGLEVTLVPLKTVPAVQSIVRSMTIPVAEPSDRPAYSLDDDDNGDS